MEFAGDFAKNLGLESRPRHLLFGFESLPLFFPSFNFLSSIFFAKVFNAFSVHKLFGLVAFFYGYPVEEVAVLGYESLPFQLLKRFGCGGFADPQTLFYAAECLGLR
jgi:hypothetical protein